MYRSAINRRAFSVFLRWAMQRWPRSSPASPPAAARRRRRDSEWRRTGDDDAIVRRTRESTDACASDRLADWNRCAATVSSDLSLPEGALHEKWEAACTREPSRARTTHSWRHVSDLIPSFEETGMTRRKQDPDYACAIEVTLDVIGGKSKGTVLHRLVRGPARFNGAAQAGAESDAADDDIAIARARARRRHLSQDLRRSSAEGRILLDRIWPELAPMLESMSDWGERYHKLVRARAAKAGSDKSASATVDSQLRIAPSHDVGTQPQD